MSNMLYACSILYKTRLPFVVVFNKVDVRDCAFAREWMGDWERFQEALRDGGPDGGVDGGGGRDADGEPTYMNSLMNSMSLVLDEFYKHLKAVSVSSYTGEGVPEFFDAVDASRAEYEK
jgi:GPN-loop GTPase